MKKFITRWLTVIDIKSIKGKNEYSAKMSTTKVAILTNIPAPYRIPLFSELANTKNIDLTVYFFASTEISRRWNVKINRKFNYEILSGFTLNTAVRAFQNIHINTAIISKLEKRKPDVIISGGYSSLTNLLGLMYARKTDTPFILWSGSTAYEHKQLKPLFKPLITLFVKNSDAFIAYGSRSKQFLQTLGVNAKSIFIAFNTVDVEYFTSQARKYKFEKKLVKRDLGFGNRKIILYVGQIIERKGIKYLIDTYKELSADDDEVCLVLVGYGPLQDKLEDYCRKSQIRNVYFMGYYPPEKIVKFYSIADLLVLPSLEEPWGLVLNEAMACGLPVISTTLVGGAYDLIIDGVNGFKVPPRNSKVLQACIREILEDPRKKETFGKNSLDIIKRNFTIKKSVKGFIRAINYVTLGNSEQLQKELSVKS